MMNSYNPGEKGKLKYDNPAGVGQISGDKFRKV
jgi:hypothetical protein